jgi:mannose-1-phosphate guanylyltransferase
MLVLPPTTWSRSPPLSPPAASSAAKLAAAGHLVTFGISPIVRKPGYGYIQADGRPRRALRGKAFAGKGARIRRGRVLWNSACSASPPAPSSARCPRIAPISLPRCAHASRAPRRGQRRPRALTPESFARVPEYLLRLRGHGEVEGPPPSWRATFGWSDIGSWSAIAELVEADAKAIASRAKPTCTRSPAATSAATIASSRRWAWENLLIIDTRDALLVADQSRAQDVKHIFAQLKAKGHDAAKLHPLVHRPWGTYEVLEEGAGYKIKRIEVKAGASLSLQMHHHRSEHWIVVNGTAKVVNGDREFLLQANESTFIPAENRHRLENPTQNPLVMIEVQCGGYLGEDDIVRFDDRYGRVPAADPASPATRR